MHDAFNLGWKLAAVLRGHAAPSLLATYSAERHPVAKELIDFDREWSAMMAAEPVATSTDAVQLLPYYVQHSRFTTGVATRYRSSPLTGGDEYQHLAKGFEVGTRFHSTPVTRVADAKRVELGHVHRADGRWRVYLFADRHRTVLDATCAWLASHPDSPVRRYTPPDADIDAILDVRAVLHVPHRDVDVAALPDLLLPRKGRFGLVDHEKAFSSFADGSDAYQRRGVDFELGAMVLVRPDQHIAQVLPLAGTADLATFLERIFIDQNPREGARDE
jgi:phenol 2-monooxygenase